MYVLLDLHSSNERPVLIVRAWTNGCADGALAADPSFGPAGDASGGAYGKCADSGMTATRTGGRHGEVHLQAQGVRHSVRIGVIFPQTDIGTDPAVVKDYGQAADELGYAFLEVWDHVILPDPNRAGPRLRYNAGTTFFEPLVLLGFLAGMTRTIELATGVLILPQRQTVLVAKQAAVVDVLSKGRLRLGVGLGWMPLQYEALGLDFHKRGRIIEEQVPLLRRLWSEQVVDFRGRFHRVDSAGMQPAPPRGTIPIWMGGGYTRNAPWPAQGQENILRRVARLADGWLPAYFGRGPDANVREVIAHLREFVVQAGRDVHDFGVEGRIPLASTPDHWRADTDAWRAFEATHMALTTMDLGVSGPDDHIRLIRRYAEEVGLKDGASVP
jgi:probable F420-dependent oxidoreductase